MKKILLLVLIVVSAFSCKKNKPVNPEHLYGTITGSIMPAGAYNVIYATDESGKEFMATVNTTTGDFKIDNLAAGKYVLSLPASTLFYPLESNSINVFSGKTTDEGMIEMEEVTKKNSGVLFYKIDGVGFTRDNQLCNFNGENLNFSAQQISFPGGIPEHQKTIKTTFSLYADKIAGPGKYTLKGNKILITQVTGTFFEPNKATINWSITGSAGKGILEVTEIDVTARSISGSFSATLVSDKPNMGNKLVTGTFFHLGY